MLTIEMIHFLVRKIVERENMVYCQSYLSLTTLKLNYIRFD